MAAIAATLIASLLLSHDGQAARDQTDAAPWAVQELIVLEAPNCSYCDVFRRDILPRYKLSKSAKELPIRFLDLNDPAADVLKLKSAITMVPTVVLIRDGREIDRITGYWGADAFFKGIAHMIGTAD
jgi:thioredoxin-related protein